ncbi:cytochrome P450 [Streptomyces hygroscopicus]|uniref:cytochrome P450 n=1 Tax=Streptomyces hygroscopicus TaxID=1912 RepID=UPI0024463ACA|nr:cytochrome P450 [Streptomyces hygroscopicus]
MLTVFLAGTETTASALTWALDLLAHHPEIEQRLHTEADTVLHGNPATHADLPRLELTERIITRTLRLYAPAWFITRTVTRDTHLGGHPLSAGSSIVHSSCLIYHRPDLYADPETVGPDRWDPKHPRPPRHAVPSSNRTDAHVIAIARPQSHRQVVEYPDSCARARRRVGCCTWRRCRSRTEPRRDVRRTTIVSPWRSPPLRSRPPCFWSRGSWSAGSSL